ncbi:hypothetical protein C9J21_18375 [Photobacterium phosphoreum]|nr:hypothetical protein C9J21_18375 [Photobacterium phosphoreum]
MESRIQQELTNTRFEEKTINTCRNLCKILFVISLVLFCASITVFIYLFNNYNYLITISNVIVLTFYIIAPLIVNIIYLPRHFNCTKEILVKVIYFTFVIIISLLGIAGLGLDISFQL